MKFLQAFLFVVIVLHCVASIRLPSKNPKKHKNPKPIRRCYGELGCLSTKGDFYNKRVRQTLPISRKMVDVRFFLYYRGLRSAKEIKANEKSILASGMDYSVPIIFIVHGFLSNGHKRWVSNIRERLLRASSVNVIQVDWRKGARTFYFQATVNTRLVGAEIALLIKKIKRASSCFQLRNVHLIGHSLGAHACGFAGKYFPREKLGRITGLDPAGPSFEGRKPGARLAKTDARFVDVIHTNARTFPVGFGIKQPIGQVDIYLNGGKMQPGCLDKRILRSISKANTCSHTRVTSFFEATINSKCPHIAYRCNSYEEFKTGKCLDCMYCRKTGYCTDVGMGAKKMPILSRHSKNIYFLDTLGVFPYCGYHYGIKVNFGRRSKEVLAQFSLQFWKSGNVGEVHLPSNRIILFNRYKKKRYHKVVRGGSLSDIVVFGKAYETFDNIGLTWKEKRSLRRPGSWIRWSKINIASIEIFSTITGNRKKYCHSGQLQQSRKYKFVLCKSSG